MEIVNGLISIIAVLGIAWAFGGGVAALVRLKLPWWANILIGLFIEAIVVVLIFIRG